MEDGGLQWPLVCAQYRLWRRNAPLLYSMVCPQVTEWPCLTCEWLPTREPSALLHCRAHSLLVGTFAPPGQSSALRVLQADLPLPPEELLAVADESFQTAAPEVTIQEEVPTDGPVRWARAMPQNSSLVAAVLHDSPAIPLFDCSRGPGGRLAQLDGHSRGATTLAFSPTRPGRLVSGGADTAVLVWDVGAEMETSVGPVVRFEGHTDVVTGVAWDPVSEDVCASVGDDGALRVWDGRRRGAKAAATVAAHTGEASCIAYNPTNPTLVATGAVDRAVALWDTRQLARRLHTFSAHTAEVTCLEWSPVVETALASGGADRRVCVWDMARIGMRPGPTDEPPGELLFVHAGHTARVADVSWCPESDDPWLLATVAEDNVMQLWRLADSVTGGPVPDVPLDSLTATPPV